MSFLDMPRLHFGGSFFTAPSTINNITTNYIPNTGDPGGAAITPVWNPNGLAQTYFRDCKVYGVVAPDGGFSVGKSNPPSWATSSDDPLLGALVETAGPQNTFLQDHPTLPPSMAKLVDMDPDQQSRSAVFGGYLYLQMSLPTGGKAGFYGKMGVPFLRNMGFAFEEQLPLGSFQFGGYWATVLTDLVWEGDVSASPLLKDLYDRCLPGATNHEGRKYTGELCLKVAVDNHQNDPLSQGETGDQFCYGRVLGTLAPRLEDDPEQVVPGRIMRPNKATDINEFRAFATLLETTTACGQTWLNADVGNSMPRLYERWFDQQANARYRSKGALAQLTGYQLGYMDGKTFTPFGAGDLTFVDAEVAADKPWKNNVYQVNSGVVAVKLTADEAIAIKNKPLAMAFNNTVYFEEAADGLYLDTLDPVSRLEQGNDGQGQAPWNALLGPSDLRLLAYQFGKPVQNSDLGIKWHGFSQEWAFDGRSNQWKSKIGPPDIAFQTSGKTDGQGILTIAVSTTATEMTLSPPRQGLQSRMSFIVGDKAIGDTAGQLGTYPFSILVWKQFTVPQTVTWEADVLPILSEYAKIYPGMKATLNIANRELVTGSYQQQMIAFMSHDPFQADFMPVTRDLAPSKAAMVVDWIKAQ